MGQAEGLSKSEDRYDCVSVNAISDFYGIEADWRNLEKESSNTLPFNSFDWYKPWRQCFEGDSPFKIYCVYRKTQGKSKLVCVLPTMQNILNGLVNYKLWTNTHSFRTALLCDKDHLDAIEYLVSQIIAENEWNTFSIPYLIVNDSVHDAFKKALIKEKINYISTPSMSSPVLELKGEWKDALSGLSRRKRESLRRKFRKFFKIDGARVIITQGTSQDLKSRLTDCWSISSKTWKHKAGSSIASDPKRIDFYEQVALENDSWLVLGMLYIDDIPVAFEYDIILDGTLYNLKLGFDEDYSNTSPGIVLRLCMLEWAYDNKVTNYDYMGNQAEYKNMLSDSTVEHENLKIYSTKSIDKVRFLLSGIIIPLVKKIGRPVKRFLIRG